MKPLVKIRTYQSRRPFSRIVFSDDAISLINSKHIVFERCENELIIRKPSFDDDNFRIIHRKIDLFFPDDQTFSGDFIIEQDGDEFILIHTTEQISNKPTIKNGKQVINTQTNQIFKTAKELAEHIGCHYRTIIGKLNGTYKNNTPYRYV